MDLSPTWMDLPENLTTLTLFSAPITSVDVKRPFSIYENLLSHKRRSFKLENIEHLVSQRNSDKYNNAV